jgi:outer membrane receptor for ferrienterochelin and colicins
MNLKTKALISNDHRIQRLIFKARGYFILLLVLFLLPINNVRGQQATAVHMCEGRIFLRTQMEGSFDSIPASGATIQSQTGAATTTDSSGRFRLRHQNPLKLLIIRNVGYHTLRINLEDGDCRGLTVTLLPAVVELKGVMVETSNALSRGAPSEVKTIDARRLEQVNASHLGEALPYSPGVQVENNCQTCGYTQVRLNGLAGPYTQILIDGQSIVGGLNAAYGLDHLPTALIDRIEVLRGGGSAAYAANAVGGVLNVVTRRPQERGWGALLQSSLIPKGGAGEHLWRVHADWVAKPKPTSGQDKSNMRAVRATAFINHRLRSPYDQDGDGFSEVARLRGTSAGFLVEKNLSQVWSLRLSSLAIEEERRGGSDWQVAAPQARLSEEILQRSISAHLEAAYRNKQNNREAQFYLSRQIAQRKAYYGGSGDSIPVSNAGTGGFLRFMGVWTAWNALHTESYGRSTEQITQAGFRWNARLLTGWQLLAGTELNQKVLVDALGLLDRSITQDLITWSQFAQVDGYLLSSLRLQLGLRSDGVVLTGAFRYDSSLTPVAFSGIPGIWRGSLRWQPEDSRLSLSLVRSGGYRAPQVFAEDLHVELVGGTVRGIRWSPGLRAERSVGYSLTTEYNLKGEGSDIVITAEAFHNQLKSPLLLNELDSSSDGALVWQKSNGPDARILGMLIGARATLGGGAWQWDASLSLQKGLYESPVRLGSGRDGDLWSRFMLRFPDWNGYITLRRALRRGWWVQYNQLISGSMWTTRTDARTGGELMLVQAPAVGQHDLWVEKQWKLNVRLRMATELGCQNFLNNYQNDLSVGPGRDASYLYGPSMPRRISVRIRLMG